MFRRLLAAVFAAFVLLVAFTIRSGDDGDGPLDPVGDERTRQVADGSAGADPYEVFDEDEGFVLLCIEDLGALCRDTFDLFGLAVRVEPAWTTVERLRAGEELGADVWITVLPFPELAEAAPIAGTPPELSAPTPVLARSPIAVTGSGAAVEALASACPDASVVLACLVDPVRQSRAILHDPATSAIGSLAFTALAIELGVDPDAPWSDDPALVEALRSSLRGVRRSQAPVEDAVRIGGTAAALSVEAELIGQLRDLEFDQRDGALASRGVRYPLDVRAAEMVAVPTTRFPRPRDLESLLVSRAVGYSFERHGWVSEGQMASFLDASVFDGRPAVRTDLPWPPDLVRELRRVVAP